MRAFVAVAEAGSFTAAGARLRVSKKLVSKYVAQLEDSLGARLFHRTTRRLSLSSAGQQYYPSCLRILEDIERTEGALRQGEVGLEGVIRITAPVAFGHLRLQPVLHRFHQENPAVVFDLSYSDGYSDIARDGFDLAIRIGELDDSSLRARRLAVTRFWLVASAGYLARAGAPRTLADLSAHECIIDTNFRSGARWNLVQADELIQHAPAGAFQVNSAEAAAQLAGAGQGIALLPDYVAEDHIARGDVVRVLPQVSTRPVPVQAVFLENRHLPLRVRRLIDDVQIAFRKG